MSRSFRVRRFANPALLRQIDPTLLVQFLSPYAEYFNGRGVDLSDTDAIDYDTLASVLADPGDEAPDALLEAVYFVDEVTGEEFVDNLIDGAHREGVALDDSHESSPADIAVRIWLKNPDVLQIIHAEQFLIRPKSFVSFLTTAANPPAIDGVDEEMLAAVQKDLDAFYEERKKGRGVRVFPFVREGVVWFLVRHGERLKREGTIAKDASGSIFYRPEKFDVLIYDPAAGEIAVHAANKGETEAYCRILGTHIFKDALFFDIGRLLEKYTLDPIRRSGRDCLVCTDVPGIESIRLVELQWSYNSHIRHVEVHRADDVFEALATRRLEIPGNARLIRASFRVKFTGATRERTVVICPPDRANFDRESDAALVEEWMRRRGFIRGRANIYVEVKPYEATAPVLGVS